MQHRTATSREVHCRRGVLESVRPRHQFQSAPQAGGCDHHNSEQHQDRREDSPFEAAWRFGNARSGCDGRSSMTSRGSSRRVSASADGVGAARIGAWLIVVLLHPAHRADALSRSVGRGRFLPRERVAGERRDAPVPGFRSTAYAAARMDRGRLSQVVRRKPSVDRNPERGRDFRRPAS